MTALSSVQDTPWVAHRAWGTLVGWFTARFRSDAPTPKLDALLDSAAADGAILLAPIEEAGALAVAGRERLTLALPRDRSFDSSAAALSALGVTVLRGLQGLASRLKPGGPAQPILVPIAADGGPESSSLQHIRNDLVRTARPVRVLRLRKPWPRTISSGLAVPISLERSDRAFVAIALQELGQDSAAQIRTNRVISEALTVPVSPQACRQKPARPATLAVYGAAANVLSIAAPLYLRRRVRRGKEDPKRLGERYGIAAKPRPDGRLAWIHAASVGESVSILPLISRLLGGNHADRVLVTTGTVTSAGVMQSRLPTGAVHAYVPLDAPRFARRFLEHWRPDLAIFVESELWPNLQSALRDRNVPLVIVNGRISERSRESWDRLPASIDWLLAGANTILAQTPANALRFATLGARNVRHVGNLKFDVPAPRVASGDLSAIREPLRMRPVWLAASTHDGEESLAGEVHMKARDRFPDLLTIIVPRHPERGDAIVEAIRNLNLPVSQRSKDEQVSAGTEVYVADTMGELGLFYKVAPVSFIGGSLVPHGGHNPIEAGLLGSAILHGPHVANFADVYKSLDECDGAIAVDDRDRLAEHLTDVLAHADTRSAMIAAARSEIEHHSGALERTVAVISPLLPARPNADP